MRSDIAGELAGRKGLRFFRNILIHEYVGLALDRAVAALDAVEPIEQSVREVAGIIEHWD